MHKADQSVPAGSNELEGTVIDASYLGVSTSYVVEARSGARLTIYEQNVERTVHGSLHRPGESVRLSWSPDHTFVVRSEPLPVDQGSPA
jgi:spermidine/putrescine transport system ATP-binding protein